VSYYYPQASIKLRILPEDFTLTSSVDEKNIKEIFVVPRNVEVNVGDHKKGDSFSCELDYKNFPFDPRFMRSCGVAVYLENIEKLEETGKPLTIIPSKANTVFMGFVDEDLVTLDDTKRIIRLEGRDFTSLLIDQKYKENVPISQSDPIDISIQNFLYSIPALQKIKFVNKTGNDRLPALSSFGPDPTSHLAGHKNTGSKETYWDIIQGSANRAGLICYISLDELILTTPRNLYNTENDLKIVYGKNIKSLTFKRKLGRFKGFNIRVRSRVGTDIVTADIPREATETWAESFGIPREDVLIPVMGTDGTIDKSKTTQTAPFITFPIPKIVKKEALISIGESVFEDYSRQQLEGTLDTNEMLGHSGSGPKDANFKVIDLTQLDIGQPLAIDIAIDDLESIGRLTSQEKRVEYLRRRNYSNDVAVLFAESIGKFSPRFFTKNYTMTLNQDSGFSLKIDFINIINLSNKAFNK
jgi:hypothetical protein